MCNFKWNIAKHLKTPNALKRFDESCPFLNDARGLELMNYAMYRCRQPVYLDLPLEFEYPSENFLYNDVSSFILECKVYPSEDMIETKWYQERFICTSDVFKAHWTNDIKKLMFDEYVETVYRKYNDENMDNESREMIEDDYRKDYDGELFSYDGVPNLDYYWKMKLYKIIEID
jgi:hypothetical protein